ncbi:MAG: ChbG/HpnK family deacetylase [Syntrophobacteraceae bacterium]|nr:ChbG/HpnK family deacetylase [Syntrophobacteraceae bacterium]
MIVNADDFGYAHGVNRAVERCFTEGIVRSTSIMAGGSAFEHAAALSRRHPRLSVGAHLVLTKLRPVSEPERLPGLVDSQGFLPPNPEALFRRLLLDRDACSSVRRELDAQMSRIADSGIRITHVDSHKHVHLLPPVLHAVMELARRYSVQWIRKPFEVGNGWVMGRGVALSRKGVFWKQHLRSRAAVVFRPWFFRYLRTTGLRFPDHFHGVSLTGLWNENTAIENVQRLAPGLNEWMFHPGEADEELQRMGTRLVRQREVEMNLLCSSRLREALEQGNIELTSFGEVMD